MLKRIIVASLFFYSMLAFCQNTAIKTIGSTEFEMAISKDKKAQILDVRTPEEFNNGAIKNAKNYNFFDANFAVKTVKLDKSKPIYVYCKVGGRSAKACSKLKELGFTSIYNLDGGIDSWTNQKKSITSKK